MYQDPHTMKPKTPLDDNIFFCNTYSMHTPPQQGYVQSFHIDSDAAYITFDQERTITLKPSPQNIIHLVCTEAAACIHCQRSIKTNAYGGYCFPCSRKLARCDLCVLKPSLCHYHLGTCREPTWGDTYCMVQHIVYLAWTSGFKIGLTRHNRFQTRLREQGSYIACPLYITDNRKIAGDIEHQLTTWYSDRTDWRKMLRNGPLDEAIFFQQYQEVVKKMDLHLGLCAQPYTPTITHYTVYGEITTQSLGKTHKSFEIQSVLCGIKGHYLIFNTGVLSLRSLIGRYITCA